MDPLSSFASHPIVSSGDSSKLLSGLFGTFERRTAHRQLASLRLTVHLDRFTVAGTNVEFTGMARDPL